MNTKTIRLGTRSSPLALKQANMVKEALESVHPSLSVEIRPIKSAADWKKQDGEKALDAQFGGKGLFAKEIEEIHLRGEIDIGVHSAKDMPSFLPDGLEVTHFLPREDARDAFISHKYKSLEDLPEGAVVGTCSPRRQSLVLSKRPDIKIVPFRGNVQTRLEKVKSGQVNATYLAMAGLKRLGVEDDMIHAVSLDDMVPAAGQGAICIEIRVQDDHICTLLDPISCMRTSLCVLAEREVLRVLDGSCRTPIGAYAALEGDKMELNAFAGRLDGQDQYFEYLQDNIQTQEQAIALGFELGTLIKSKIPDGFLQ